MTKIYDIPFDKYHRFTGSAPGEGHADAFLGHPDSSKKKVENGYFIPEPQAYALLEGARMIIESQEWIENKCDCPSDHKLFQAIALLKKGIGG